MIMLGLVLIADFQVLLAIVGAHIQLLTIYNFLNLFLNDPFYHSEKKKLPDNSLKNFGFSNSESVSL